MKVLLDTCVWGKAREELEAAGQDVIWAGDWERDPGDDEILDRAFKDGRVLVTLDKDFGKLAVLKERPHSGIVRLVNLSARKQARACLDVLKTHGEDLSRGAIVTVERGWLRVRMPQSP
ncbi:MAG: DUF5615 family PIN-like protein [bacterium]